MKKVLVVVLMSLSTAAFAQEAGNFEVTRTGKLPAWLTSIKGHTEAKVCGSNEASNEAPCVKVTGTRGAVVEVLQALGAVIKSDKIVDAGQDAGGN